MNHLIWRLHRNQVAFASLALGLVTVLLLITGTVMAHDYHVYMASCAPAGTCDGPDQLFRGDGAIIDLVNFTVVVPLLFGLFWGAPLLAKELEDGTQNLAWTQGVSRRRWLRANVVSALVAAALWGAALTALVSWWRIPENALGSRFSAFDIQGVAPIAYAVFAVALGIAVGSVIRRVLPAIATTLGVFVGLRVLISTYLRPHYETAITGVFPIGSPKSLGPPGSWILSTGFVGPSGRIFTDFSLADLPAACRRIFIGGGGISAKCVGSHGFKQLVTYQPDSRFWAFQGIESGLFLIVAAGLVALGYKMVLTRDA